jgi:acyl transferase domain-containing protein/NAD(P)H-dependent flavin oxidoreductase YrpB (nitropropane dioxygenase family)
MRKFPEMTNGVNQVVPKIASVIGISPFEDPDVGLVRALSRAGALGVLDLGHSASRARAALADAKASLRAPFGVRIPEQLDVTEIDLPPGAHVVVVPASRGEFQWGRRTVLAQITTLAEARGALQGGAHGLIVKGNEAGGCVGDETSFVLLQRVLAETGARVWVQGGIGLHTAAACIAAGARGVVLDSQLALLEDAGTSAEVRRAVQVMDGSETVIVDGYRLYSHPKAAKVDEGAPIAPRLGATDPARELLALGQDAAFAAPLAARFATVERVVRAFHAAWDGHLRQARLLRPLARHSPLAEAYGSTFPIVQGPMTRVSDRAAFADDVARAGGMPFIALSLMRGQEARALLEETRHRLRGRAWGVGILGFLPQDVRDEQLALLTSIRPPLAIIAGGRPSQARPLEEVGIATFLHVPSPGLLDLFLKEGGRRFVFEGRECGGHVGPRPSFVLWEAAVERLLLRGALDDVEVLFAGGIHDARSASMVAALAAPLAARGAKVGVLMGTAYLFTEEAVRSGAIQPAFQEAAIDCKETALLTTAPGHSTRCADSSFVRAFERERQRLVAEGADAQTTWAALERMNLGRLRIAAKGLRREGTALVRVSDDDQRRDGMFMIGQIAALRRARCTIDELHRDVGDASVAALEAAALPEPLVMGEATGVDIAIVGMACMFPDAPDLEAFWSNIVLGRSAIREVSKDRWDPAIYFDAAGTGEKTPSKWGGFLSPTLFDPAEYGIPPRSLAAIDPVQLLSLEVARRALDDAGWKANSFDRERGSVVFGAEGGTDLANAYGFRASFAQFVGALPESLDKCLPKLTEDSFAGVLANVIAGRIANRLDLRGVNYTVDAACASSLAAIDVACKELASGSSDFVVAGGADLHNGLHDFLMFASVHALSPTGQSRPFDAKGDGIALGEGVAAVVLKRLADAEHDGDRIYAVLKGVGSSSDGKNLGLTAPRKEGQIRALERAYLRARVAPAEVGLVEAHGTGTVVGDRTELAALTDFFGAAGAVPASCTLGSVKSQIGHTKCAAGLAGLIKVALAIHRGVLPPTRNITSPNPGYEPTASPFVLRDRAAPWVKSKRTGSVSAFGFGGTNFHAVLESHGAPSGAAVAHWPAELFVLRGNSHADVLALVERLDAIAGSEAPPALRDLAFAAAQSNLAAPVSFAIVAANLGDLRAKFGAVRKGEAADDVHVAHPVDPNTPDGSVAFLFPGQGSQRPGMLGDLFASFSEMRELLELGRPFLGRLFPGGAYTPETRAAQQRAITDTRVAQPMLGIVELALARLLERAGVRPAMAAGHSYGELVALAVMNAFDADTLVALSEARARSILEAASGEPGTMAAVRAPLARVEELLGRDAGVTIANHNAPDQVVIAGPALAIAEACTRLAAAHIEAKAIPVACAFHSPIVAGASATFAAHLERAEIYAPSGPVYANATAKPYEASDEAVRATLSCQIALPVRFVDEIEAMYARGARVFVEVGPGGVLTDLVRRILADRPHVGIATDKSGGPGVTGYLSALARLIAAGVAVNVESLFADRASPCSLDALYAAPPTAWLVDGGGARPVRGELPEFAMKPLAGPVGLVTGVAVNRPFAEREATVRDYLNATRALVEAQRAVMLQYLGDTAPSPRVLPSASAKATEPFLPALPAPVVSATVAPSIPPAAKSALALLIETVGERTGYPPDMLDPDLDLEADLGVDSIKRVEILGEMRSKLGLGARGAVNDALIEKLASVKTLRSIALLLERPEESTPIMEAPPTSMRVLADLPSGPLPESAVNRYVLDVASTPPPPTCRPLALRDKRFAIVPDTRGVAAELQERLVESGASSRLVAADEALGDIDGLVYLATISPNCPTAIRALFGRVQEAVRSNAKWIIAATSLGGRFGRDEAARAWSADGAGVAGMLKSLAKERPLVSVRAIDLDGNEPPPTLAEHVLSELVSEGTSQVEVGYVGGERHELVIAERGSTPPESPLKLDKDSVVLFTGGARGITASIAIATARRFGCTIELVGRSPLMDEEDGELRACIDVATVKRKLIERANGAGKVSPATIEAQCRQIFASRAIRETLAAIRETSARADYHAVDVRDEVKFGALLDRLRARHGHIDGIVHGAGLIEDKLLDAKTPDSFDRVYQTKVAGARTLADKLARDARLFVLFSSVSGTFGNRGQTDYAAANDALDKLAHHLHRTVRGRVLSINWGPWRGAGMVSPELAREYDRRGIGLIEPEHGIARFFDEVLHGTDPQVILTAARAEQIA